MSTLYISRLLKLIERAGTVNADALDKAAAVLSESLANKGLVHLYGSGHSVLPVQETFPRYGSYVGFNPLTDPRVMWHNVLGAGGVRELLWLERTEKYAEKFLDHQPLNAGDSIVIFGHSGRNSSGIDTAIYAKKRGLTVIAITAKANLDKPATHSSGKRLADAAGPRGGVTDAAGHHFHEHADQADHGTEQAQQRSDQGDRAQRVEVAFHPMDDMPAGVLDALLDQLARLLAHGQCGSQQFTQRRTVGQIFEVARIELSGARPLTHLVGQAGWQDRLAAQRPATLKHDCQGNRRTDQDGHHRPATSHQDFQHFSTHRATGQ